PTSVPLGLGYHVLCTSSGSLTLHDADDMVVEPERIVSGAVVRLLLLGAIRVTEWRGAVGRKSPAGGVQLRVDASLPSAPLGLVQGASSHDGRASYRDAGREGEDYSVALGGWRRRSPSRPPLVPRLP